MQAKDRELAQAQEASGGLQQQIHELRQQLRQQVRKLKDNELLKEK